VKRDDETVEARLIVEFKSFGLLDVLLSDNLPNFVKLDDIPPASPIPSRATDSAIAAVGSLTQHEAYAPSASP